MTSPHPGPHLHLVDGVATPLASHEPHAVLAGVTKDFDTPDQKRPERRGCRRSAPSI